MSQQKSKVRKTRSPMPSKPQPLNRDKPQADDGTTQLVRWGSLITAVGVVAIGLLMTVLGGVGVEGARSNSGWLALITGMMCLPFGLMLTVLGAAKWLRKRNLNGGK
jgi:hypothetical protein